MRHFHIEAFHEYPLSPPWWRRWYGTTIAQRAEVLGLQVARWMRDRERGRAQGLRSPWLTAIREGR